MKRGKAKIIKLLLLILMTLFSQLGSAQSIMSTSKDSLISIYLNSKIVNDIFFKTAKFTSDTLFFLDPKEILKKVNPTIWKGHTIKIITTNPLIDSINKFGVYEILKNKNNYFLLEKFRWRKNGIRILFSLPSQNLYSEGVIIKVTGSLFSLNFLGHPEFP